MHESNWAARGRMQCLSGPCLAQLQHLTTSAALAVPCCAAQKELAEISLDPPCNCSAGPKGDNIYE